MERNQAGDDAAREQAQAVPGHQASDLPDGVHHGQENVIRQKLGLLDTVNKAAQSHQFPEKGSSVVHLQR